MALFVESHMSYKVPSLCNIKISHNDGRLPSTILQSFFVNKVISCRRMDTAFLTGKIESIYLKSTISLMTQPRKPLILKLQI